MAEDIREKVANELEKSRRRSAVLTDAVDDGDLIKQHSPLMSPLVWDLAHIGNQEELWLVRDVGGREPLRQDIDHLYDAFKHARSDRPALPLLGPAEARAYVAQVRDKALDVLDRTRFGEGEATHRGNRLVADGFAFGMIVQHEQQHDETMLATHQLRAGPAVLAAEPPPPARIQVRGEVLVPGGPFTMGTSTEPWALDNERPAHVLDVPAYFIDAAPVTNAQYAAFLDATGAPPPLHWSHDPGGWLATSFGRTAAIVPDAPVVHVSFPQAQAYATWAGRRLPTEAEWEKAARHDPATGRSRRYPWGDADPGPEHANLGQRHLSPAPVGAYPAGASPLGVHQLIGDVWEWVDSDFAPYPGFAAFPYREYSEVFFGPDYKVLRGGSFGTDPSACRGTFRNWDYPIRRQIFSGFRTARDPSPAELA